MYITYETAQYSWNDKDIFIKHVKPSIIIPNELPKPDFMPTKLVRISDMKVVDGSQVNEGYCALSYSWNQSGDILLDEKTGKYKRVDDGKHEIISYDDIYPDMIIPEYKTKSNSKLDKVYQVLRIIDNENYYFTKTVQYVKFEGIIQQMCQQFNIKYIWYDQLCINQDNKEEKHHEIRNMHHIYENAYCTVALVPDYYHDSLLFSSAQYFTRLWTLGEAIKSKRLLFVGRDEYDWGDYSTFIEIIQLTKSSSELSVSQILCHAHQRTSTNEHDRVFALIQLFPEFMDEIDIDYDQKLEDLMIQFYILLAKKDISILFFRNKYKKTTIEKYKSLPSWTGINGRHFIFDITTSFQNYDIIGKTMHVTTTYVTKNQSIDDDSLIIQEEDIPPIPDDINDDNKDDYRLCILVQLSKANEMKIIDLDRYGHYWNLTRKSFFYIISTELQQLSRFVEIKKENLCWYNIESDAYRMTASIDFGDFTGSLDDPSAKYVILSEISFETIDLKHIDHRFKNKYYLYPVIKKEQGEEFYKAIGCCKIFCKIGSNEDFFSDCNLNKETFLIQ